MSTKALVRIAPTRGLRWLDLRELWRYRGLAYFLTWRDINVRYKQTAIGIGWALLQPLAMMAVFSLFFGRLAKLSSDGVPYPVFALTALLPWQLFSRAVTESTHSLLVDQRLLTRVYFPRLLIPVASVLSALVDFLIALVLLVAVMAVHGVGLSANVVWAPVFTFLMLVTALGAGLWLSALNVEYRDVMYLVPFLNQFWFFITPVAYASSLVPEKWRLLYGLNPMVGVIDGFRWAVLGAGKGPSFGLICSVGVAIALFVSGAVWFRYRERAFVDVIGSADR